jgi:hypothetical protein
MSNQNNINISDHVRVLYGSHTKFAAAAVGMIGMMIAAGRQLYLFMVFRNREGLLDAQGGRYHLWLAVGAILAASLAACLMFLFFTDRRKSKRSAWESPLIPRPALIKINPNAASLTGNGFNASRRERLNDWCVEGQADDRRLMNGSVGKSIGAASSQRSAARLTHQVMYRKWAGERHD